MGSPMITTGGPTPGERKQPNFGTSACPLESAAQPQAFGCAGSTAAAPDQHRDALRRAPAAAMTAATMLERPMAKGTAPCSLQTADSALNCPGEDSKKAGRGAIRGVLYNTTQPNASSKQLPTHAHRAHHTPD